MSYPRWICAECGEKHGNPMPENHLATWHLPGGDDHCGWCKRIDVPLTEPRDFGYPKDPIVMLMDALKASVSAAKKRRES